MYIGTPPSGLVLPMFGESTSMVAVIHLPRVLAIVYEVATAGMAALAPNIFDKGEDRSLSC